ncbi:cuticle protein 7-like [Procambarus clarkii]|uniref:cuticle protein 7-like n=1 Tax=Procambarus clarkii TaxID=6728 RepID=UPI003743333D
MEVVVFVAALVMGSLARAEPPPGYRPPYTPPTHPPYTTPPSYPSYTTPKSYPSYTTPSSYPSYTTPPTYPTYRPSPTYGVPTSEAPARYDFNYTVKDDASGNDFGHQESRDGPHTQGSYYVLLPDGRLEKVAYTVDGDSGYVAQVTYEGQAQHPTTQPQYPSYEPQYPSPQPQYPSPHPQYPSPKPTYPSTPYYG